MTTYQRGFEDAKRMAVEKVERILRERHAFYRQDQWPEIAAIRSIAPPGQEETHEERWAKAGWPFKWEEGHRAYVDRADGFVLAVLPTVQAVDAFIAQKRDG